MSENFSGSKRFLSFVLYPKAFIFAAAFLLSSVG